MKKYLKELPLAIIAFAIINHGALPISLPYQLRFVADSYNAGFSILIIVALPIAIFVRTVQFKNIYVNILGGILFIAVLGLYILGSFALILILMNDISTIKNGKNVHFLLEKDIEIKGYHYRLYHTVCGAGCSERIILRKEKNVLPGFKIIKQLYITDAYNTVTLMVIEPDRVQLVDINSENKADVKKITYKP
ncbi:MAG: hypothetical protein GXP00_03295 [Alphaproteobacteria bacterium]|nr:hypothetical protein [Alphaproteobacteria bacterium]